MDPSLVRGQHAGVSGRYDGTAENRGGFSDVAEGLPQFGTPQGQGAVGRPQRGGGGEQPHSAGGASAALWGSGSDGFGRAHERSWLLGEQEKGGTTRPAVQQREKHLQSMAFMVTVPWFTFICLEVAVSMLPFRILVWVLILGSLGAAALLVQVYQQSRTVFYLHLGALVALAVVVATLVGSVIFERSTLQFWMSRSRVSHYDVQPSELAFAFADANALHFAKGTKVDMRRSFGLRSPARSGATFCVAPLVNRALVEKGEVHFWAAGLNCCEPLAGFRCGQARRPGVRSGYVINPGGGAGSQYAISEYEQFNRAAQQAAAIYHLGTEDTPVFVLWTEHPEAQLSKGLDEALAWAGVLALLYLMLSLVLAICLHWQAVFRINQAWQP